MFNSFDPSQCATYLSAETRTVKLALNCQFGLYSPTPRPRMAMLARRRFRSFAWKGLPATSASERRNIRVPPYPMLLRLVHFNFGWGAAS
jgi:hypothetical protein